MKLIIDIDEKRYKDIQRIASVQIDRQHYQTAEQIIAKGIPLEDIKEEIENMSILSSVDIKTGETLYEGLCRYSDVLEIIDKHCGGDKE